MQWCRMELLFVGSKWWAMGGGTNRWRWQRGELWGEELKDCCVDCAVSGKVLDELLLSCEGMGRRAGRGELSGGRRRKETIVVQCGEDR